MRCCNLKISHFNDYLVCYNIILVHKCVYGNKYPCVCGVSFRKGDSNAWRKEVQHGVCSCRWLH
jgi:hypothetical protein